jgi:hypothetical protein
MDLFCPNHWSMMMLIGFATDYYGYGTLYTDHGITGFVKKLDFVHRVIG